jgi:prevent-host-death family protein
MKSQLSISEVKNKLTSIIHDIENGGQIQVTRHGRTVAVLLSVNEYEDLIGKKEGLWEKYLTFRSHISKSGLDMDDSVFDTVRDRSAGRDVEFE